MVLISFLKPIKSTKLISKNIGPRLIRIAVPCGHRDAFSNERREVPHVSRGLLSRPRATEPQVKRETRSVLCHSLVVNLTFEESENVAFAVVQSSSSC